jgi:hypothetical protein
MRYRVAWLSAGYLWIAVVTYLSLKTGPHHLSGSAFEDKIEHVAAFMAPALWFGQLYGSPRGRRNVGLFFLALGVLLEVIQQQIGHFPEIEWGDVAANSAGVALGWLLLRARMVAFLPRVDRWLERRIERN